MDLAGGLILPVRPGLQRPIERDGSRPRTIIDTAAAIPALIRVQDQGRLALPGIRNIDIDLADFHTMIAAIAAFGIESDRLVGRGHIGQSFDFILGHIILPLDA